MKKIKTIDSIYLLLALAVLGGVIYSSYLPKRGGGAIIQPGEQWLMLLYFTSIIWGLILLICITVNLWQKKYKNAKQNFVKIFILILILFSITAFHTILTGGLSFSEFL